MARSAQNHYIKQCWLIFNHNSWNIQKLSMNLKSQASIQTNWFQNIRYKITKVSYISYVYHIKPIGHWLPCSEMHDWPWFEIGIHLNSGGCHVLRPHTDRLQCPHYTRLSTTICHMNLGNWRLDLTWPFQIEHFWARWLLTIFKLALIYYYYYNVESYVQG